MTTYVIILCRPNSNLFTYFWKRVHRIFLPIKPAGAMKDATSTAAKAAKAAKAMKAMKDAKAAKASKAGKPMKAAHSQGAKAMHADHSQGVRPTKIRVKRWSAVGFGWRLVPRPPRVCYVRTYVRTYVCTYVRTWGPPHCALQNGNRPLV